MELRPYQQEAREAVEQEWEQGHDKTLLVLPTGCGKTIVFAKITEDRVRAGDRVLILSLIHIWKKLARICWTQFSEIISQRVN